MTPLTQNEIRLKQALKALTYHEMIRLATNIQNLLESKVDRDDMASTLDYAYYVEGDEDEED